MFVCLFTWYLILVRARAARRPAASLARADALADAVVVRRVAPAPGRRRAAYALVPGREAPGEAGAADALVRLRDACERRARAAEAEVALRVEIIKLFF